VLCCDDQRDYCRRILHKLKNARERKIVAGRVLTVRRCVVGHAAAHMCFHGRSVRYRCYAIPSACVRDTEGERKQPQPKGRAGESLSMAAQQQLRHGFLRAIYATRNQHFSESFDSEAVIKFLMPCIFRLTVPGSSRAVKSVVVEGGGPVGRGPRSGPVRAQLELSTGPPPEAAA